MDTLRVRVYNVLFGDAILVSIPERSAHGRKRTQHVLFDVGNALSGGGGDDAVFEPIVRDIQDTIGGDTVDLYVMTHEHMDHTQGLPYVAEKSPNVPPLKARFAWLTGSSDPDYYRTHEAARKQKSLYERALAAIDGFYASAAESPAIAVRAMLMNNNPRSTADCVDFLRRLAPPDATSFVSRGIPAPASHPFQEARFEIWAPEEDTSAYYRRLRPMSFGASDAGLQNPATRAAGGPLPPRGVDAGAFSDLVEARRQNLGDNLLAIDRAANNTSVVVHIEWRGWRLLFPGDAEQASWRMMDRQGVLKPVHFLKVGHHGSANATPPPSILDKILPVNMSDSRPRRAVVSTHLDSYSGVPDPDTLVEISTRCALESVCVVRERPDGPRLAAPGFTACDLAPGKYVDVVFEG